MEKTKRKKKLSAAETTTQLSKHDHKPSSFCTHRPITGFRVPSKYTNNRRLSTFDSWKLKWLKKKSRKKQKILIRVLFFFFSLFTRAHLFDWYLFSHLLHPEQLTIVKRRQKNRNNENYDRQFVFDFIFGFRLGKFQGKKEDKKHIRV